MSQKLQCLFPLPHIHYTLLISDILEVMDNLEEVLHYLEKTFNFLKKLTKFWGDIAVELSHMINGQCNGKLQFLNEHTITATVIEWPTRWLHGFKFRHGFEIIRDSSYRSCSRHYVTVVGNRLMWENAAQIQIVSLNWCQYAERVWSLVNSAQPLNDIWRQN